jgi:hypothetical protein
MSYLSLAATAIRLLRMVLSRIFDNGNPDQLVAADCSERSYPTLTRFTLNRYAMPLSLLNHLYRSLPGTRACV